MGGVGAGGSHPAVLRFPCGGRLPWPPPPLASEAQAEPAGSPLPFHFLHQITSTEELMRNGQMGSILM